VASRQSNRIALFDAHQRKVGEGANSNTYFEQTSFYLIPIMHIKAGAYLKVDFQGARSDFGVSKFNRDAVAGAPSFVRLDEYDSPSDPDLDATAQLLAREYPDFFKK
jgi:hypothetical protein